MLRKRRGLASVALVAGLSMTAVACGGDGGTTTGGGTNSGGTEAGDAERGGTLRMLGAGDIDHMDTASAYYTVSYTLLRGITRQLVSYETVEDFEQASEVVPDLATEVPEPSDDGRTYSFTIREGAQWDAPGGPRQITGDDVVRGFKRLCNPVQPTGALKYFVGVIEGMAEFCDGFAQAPDTVEGIKSYIDQNEISGITADGQDVQFTLVQPAGDFLNILALPFSSPVAEEMLDYVPDSPEFRQNFVSSGPYKLESYTADQSIVLVRNPAWDEESDDLRGGYVDRIEITQGSDEGPVQQQLEAGTADLSWDTKVPTARLPALQAADDPKLVLYENGSTNPYIVFNLQSPNANGALQDVEVRRAINYAVNKKNIIQVLGGPDIAEPIGQILTPTILGYQEHDPYATPDSAGDPEKAKQMLADAGHPQGLDLIFLFRNRGKAPQIATTLQSDLEKAGIRLQLKQVPPADFYTQVLQKPAAAAAGEWDLAAPGWFPDWQGNAARTFFSPLLDSRSCGEGSTNYSCYSNDEVNELIDQALAEQDLDRAAEIWHEADVKVMEDAPWVPIATGKDPFYHSDRVQNYIPFSFAGGNADITNVWLEGGGS